MEPVGDQLNIETPELVPIELPLAGIGSRFIAILIDTLVLGGAVLVFVLVLSIVIPALGVFGGTSANWVIGIFCSCAFSVGVGIFRAV